MGHIHEKITFEGTHGRLSGNLQLPDGDVRAGVVLAHCFTCSKSFKVTRNLATGIEDGGYAVLRFDFTGLGESEGEFTDTSVTTYVSDLAAAARYMQKSGFGPCVMVGHSLGGAAALLAAGGVPQVKAVVAVAAPATADHVRHLFSDTHIEEALRRGQVDVTIAGRRFAISAEFFHDLARHSSLDHITALNRPILVVHGTADRIVAIGEGERIFSAAQQPRWFAAIPEADHLFTRQVDADKAARVIVNFLNTVLQPDDR
ncbi:MAG: alpha/beta fold hydrolase [Gemmatimonadota bacterium]|nr:MAG: alpha/beta fold hydrolase [Gemmatimonadota bacterium]